MRGNFPGEIFPHIFPEKCRDMFSRKSFFLQKFPTKVLGHKPRKSLIYRLQSIIQVWFVSNVVVKICGENFPSGEFREIRETSRRETSRRENFPREFPPEFSGIFRKPLCKPRWKSVLGRISGKFLHKFLRHFRRKCWENFFLGEVSPESFLRNYCKFNFVKRWFTGCNQLYTYKLLVILWWNFVAKISRRENFGKSGKLPDGKISPRNSPRDFRAFSENRSVNQGEKVASGEFRENFSTIFPEIPVKPDRKLPGFGKFPDKFPSEIPGV